MSPPQNSLKPKKARHFRSLSDPHTLSELALRLQEGIYIVTMDGEIVDANPAFLEMHGVDSLEDLKGYRTSDFVKPEVRAREIELLEREGSVRDIEFQLTRRDGEARTVVDSAWQSDCVLQGRRPRPCRSPWDGQRTGRESRSRR